MATTTEGGTAYELLSKPTLDLTDAEVDRVVAELRQKRHAYVTNKTPDKPAKARAAAAPPTAAEKASNTAAIAAAMNLDFDL